MLFTAVNVKTLIAPIDGWCFKALHYIRNTLKPLSVHNEYPLISTYSAVTWRMEFKQFVRVRPAFPVSPKRCFALRFHSQMTSPAS
ncbi:hypothetical protein CEXT_573901 [Caerostris extrusa]|uniref:Uncharacterized protein n=1 Tax=Caerostris extrusa TaxID=172846 RepID=A0AAV4TEK8_CAEEX|nr:hypothetical protein CEXT_573901 [Caerostris extrusa]